MGTEITRDNLLWLLTADRDSGVLGEAPGWLVDECRAKGLVAGDAAPYRLTERGWSVRDLGLNGWLPGQK